MLNLIGLGLNDETDLSLKAIAALKASDRIYLDTYTGLFNGSIEGLKRLCGREIAPLNRADLEERPNENVLRDGNVSLLVVGDPMVATTHADLVLRACKLGIEVRVIHASSVYSAVAETGLQIYKFGRTTTIAYPEGSYFPKSPYDVIIENRSGGLHTLCLLDVKATEGRYMTVNEGLGLLLQMGDEICPDTLCVGIARLGGDAVIKYGRAERLIEVDFGGPPHTIIVPGKLHFLEEEMLARFTL